MPKKKISSQDFLNLMEEQDAPQAKPTFKPTEKRKPAPQKTLLRIGRYQLTPVQDELVRFIFTRTPGISKLAPPDRLQEFADRLDDTFANFRDKLRQLRK